MQFIIRNSGRKDQIFHFDDATSVCLKPNECYSHEGDDVPQFESNQYMWISNINWGELEYTVSEEMTIVGNSRYDVKMPVDQSWKKEGF